MMATYGEGDPTGNDDWLIDWLFILLKFQVILQWGTCVNNENSVKKSDLHAKHGSLQGCPSDRIGATKLTGPNSKMMMKEDGLTG